jgi:hypothetical protein
MAGLVILLRVDLQSAQLRQQMLDVVADCFMAPLYQLIGLNSFRRGAVVVDTNLRGPAALLILPFVSLSMFSPQHERD